MYAEAEMVTKGEEVMQVEAGAATEVRVEAMLPFLMPLLVLMVLVMVLSKVLLLLFLLVLLLVVLVMLVVMYLLSLLYLCMSVVLQYAAMVRWSFGAKDEAESSK